MYRMQIVLSNMCMNSNWILFDGIFNFQVVLLILIVYYKLECCLWSNTAGILFLKFPI